MHRLIRFAFFCSCFTLLAGCTITATINAIETPLLHVELVESEGGIKPLPTVDPGDTPNPQPDSRIIHIVNLVDSSETYSGTWAIQDRQNLSSNLMLILAGLDSTSKLIATDQPALVLAHPVSIPLSNTLTLYVPGAADLENRCDDPTGFFWQEVFTMAGHAESIHMPINEVCTYPAGTSLNDLAEELRQKELVPDIVLVEKTDVGHVLFRFVLQDGSSGAGSVISRLICGRLRSDTRMGSAVRSYVGC